MHSFMEIGQVVLDKKRTFKIKKPQNNASLQTRWSSFCYSNKEHTMYGHNFLIKY